MKRQYHLPTWMKSQMPAGKTYTEVKNIVNNHRLHTICKSGNCPNIGDCWNRGTATFMILGDICTRSCKFCGVKTGKPLPPDPEEPLRLAESIRLMKLKHAVITSVDRDDLEDKGAKHWAETIRAVKQENPGLTIEVLIPDFDARAELIDNVIREQPEVISHNLETVERLTPLVRSRAKYRESLKVIHHVARSGIRAKSGIMLGIGESADEVLQTMDDLLACDCKIMTLGQYLQPSPANIPVSEFISPEQFQFFEKEGLRKGFEYVESHPLVRSSYHAEKHVNPSCSQSS